MTSPLILRTVVIYLTVLASVPVMAFDSGCARTPQLAIRLAKSDATEQFPLHDSGYRVRSMQYDPVLRRQWAVIADCEHPERPTFALPVDFPSRGLSRRGDIIHDQPVAVVHAGDLVQAWQQRPNMRLEVAARAEESGEVGKHVRIRIARSGFGLGQPLTVTGIVRGPGNVEIVQ